MKQDSRLTILFYNTCWIAIPDPIPDCPVECVLTRDRAALKEADAVVFHIPTTELPIRARKHRGQKWIALSMESDVNYPILNDQAFMRQFDLTMTYRWDADICTPYFGPAMLERLLTPPREKTDQAPVVYMASNPLDRSGRTAYVRELMDYITVDSYGRCLQNKTLVDDAGRETKLATFSRYRFTLAFENSISKDYVTEKFFDPLIVGSVPVYLGAPNIRDFAPAEKSFIDAGAYHSPRDLAHHLHMLTARPDLYDEYLAWKRQGVTNPTFLAMMEHLRIHPMCRLCLALCSVSGPQGPGKGPLSSLFTHRLKSLISVGGGRSSRVPWRRR
ncbi:MAG TPA: glycosyltransferase family 10 [Chloroflexota bacterium]|nr:glycosyltransferase family 10 [Chloroflexota bacterium]